MVAPRTISIGFRFENFPFIINGPDELWKARAIGFAHHTHLDSGFQQAGRFTRRESSVYITD